MPTTRSTNRPQRGKSQPSTRAAAPRRAPSTAKTRAAKSKPAVKASSGARKTSATREPPAKSRGTRGKSKTSASSRSRGKGARANNAPATKTPEAKARTRRAQNVNTEKPTRTRGPAREGTPKLREGTRGPATTSNVRAKTTQPSRKPVITRNMDAIEMLLADHQVVAGMFKKFRGLRGNSGQRYALAQKVCQELQMHSMIEELYLYPAVGETLPETDRLIGHSMEEHQTVGRLVMEILGLGDGYDRLEDLMEELMTSVEEHVAEEESRLFPAMREQMRRKDLIEMARPMKRAKKTQLAEVHAA
jgi:hemerythrin superfamily protein